MGRCNIGKGGKIDCGESLGSDTYLLQGAQRLQPAVLAMVQVDHIGTLETALLAFRAMPYLTMPRQGHSIDFTTSLQYLQRPAGTLLLHKGERSLAQYYLLSGKVAVDAKFPLEAWNVIRETENPEQKKMASQQFKRDMEVHIRDISEKYLIAGETQDMAFLFVPSESIFAEIHENFEGVVQKAHRQKVVIVSPSLLMLSIQVIQAVLKDQRMREQAHLIQGEVIRLMEDLSRLDDRTRKLQSHFIAAQKDVEMIITSSDKLAKRGAKIEAMEFETPGGREDGEEIPSRAVESRTGMLKLRVVDED